MESGEGRDGRGGGLEVRAGARQGRRRGPGVSGGRPEAGCEGRGALNRGPRGPGDWGAARRAPAAVWRGASEAPGRSQARAGGGAGGARAWGTASAARFPLGWASRSGAAGAWPCAPPARPTLG